MDYTYQCSCVVLCDRTGTTKLHGTLIIIFLSRVFIALSFLVYITIPILRWLADAKLGNYIKFSCFILLVVSIGSTHILCIIIHVHIQDPDTQVLWL